MNKTKETYIAALYGVTPEQQQELRRAIQYTWGQIAYDVHIGDHATEDQQMIELCLDADRLKHNGDIGDWFDDVGEKMLLAFDAYEVYPDEFWKSHAERNNIEMWMLR
tara:strand:- start:77 stop:400 length:324 start_codon:yes stop_codon:yes gene_type:complete